MGLGEPPLKKRLDYAGYAGYYIGMDGAELGAAIRRLQEDIYATWRSL